MDEETADWVNALDEALDGADSKEVKPADYDDEADDIGEAYACDHDHDEAIEIAHGLHLDNGMSCLKYGRHTSTEVLHH